jgi:hypothetical protein
MGVRTRTTERLAQLFLTVVTVASAATAYAQAPGAPPPPPPAEAAPPPPAYPPPPPMAVAPTPAPMAPAETGPSDLDPSVRRWAIGYAGISQVPVGSPAVPVATVPAVGLRYWSSPTMGIDLALGFGWAGGSQDVAGTSTDKDSVFAFVFQGGVPFALSTHRHVSFQVIPFLSAGYGKQSISAAGGGYSTDYSGLRLDVGARAGFELFFGFIGIPELALSATVGAQFEMVKFSQDVAGTSASDTTLSISTTVEKNPWDIFAGNVAARYYF